ncbi:MAG: BLUF domain-containing protein [Aeromicrobium sp.]
MPLLSLTYVSSATELLAMPELLHMLAAIRPRNETLGLSGLLLYSGGNIIQVLEGPEDAVESTFRAIMDDPRHKDVIVMLRDPIEQRAFPDWSMGFRTISRTDVQRVEGLSTFLQGPLATEFEDRAEPSFYLLQLFKETMR